MRKTLRGHSGEGFAPGLLGAGWAALVAMPRLIAQALSAERERWVLWVPVLFAIGIAGYFAWPSEPPLWVAGAIALGASAALWWARRGGLMSPIIIASILLFGALGVGRAGLETRMSESPTLIESAGAVRLSGTVIQVENFPKGPRVVLSQISYQWRTPDPAPERLRVRLRRGEDVRIGQRIGLLAVLRAPPRPSYPGGYDFARRAWFEGLGAVGFAISTVEPPEGGPVPPLSLGLQLQAQIDAIRQSITRTIRAGLDGEAGDVAAALITGDRSGLSEESVEAMRQSGLAHLLAISGLHIGLAAGAVFVGLRALLALHERLALFYPIKKWAAAAGMIAAFIYLLLAGATVPTQRAFLMTGLVLTAVMLDRKAISMRMVAIAAAIVLLVQPQAVVGPSFQLSFAAVIALVGVYESWRPLKRADGAADVDGLARWGRKIALYLLLITATTVIAGAATAPFAWHHFGRLANYGVIGNLVAIPMMAWLVMPAGVIAMLVMPFGVEAIPLAVMGWGIEAILAIAHWVADLPGSTVSLAASPGWAAALVAFGGLWAALWQGRWRMLGALPVVVGLFAPLTLGQPHLIVSETGRQVALTGPAGDLWLAHPRREKFQTGIWSQRTGRSIAGGWPELLSVRTGGVAPLRCGPLGCYYRLGGQLVALSKDPRSLGEDCRHADIIIATVTLPWALAQGACRGRVVIGPSDRAGAGTHVLYLSEDKVRLRTVEAARGTRPWTNRARGE
jgi:competence protein ComEC